MIGDPPSFAGGVQETTVEVSPATTVRDVGASGAAAGVADAVAIEVLDAPIALMAATVNV